MADMKTVRAGMYVRCADGERIGRVLRVDDDRLLVEKGVFFPKDWLVHADQIAGVYGDVVRLKCTRAALAEPSDDEADAGEEPLAGEEATLWTSEHDGHPRL